MAKKQWNENSALSVVKADGFNIVGKMIRKEKGQGASGLSKLSAIDYLVKCHGYKF